MFDILFDDVRRCQVSTTSKPPLPGCPRSILRCLCLEISVVEMQCWRKGIVWVDNRANAGSEEGHGPGLLRARRRVGPRRAVRVWGHDSVDDGHVHGGLLEHAAALQHAADTAASARARPRVLPEHPATAAAALLDCLERRAHLRLHPPDQALEPRARRRRPRRRLLPAEKGRRWRGLRRLPLHVHCGLRAV